MSRWHGKVGFDVCEEEGTSGIYSSTITEKDYLGEIYSIKVVQTSGTNPNGELRMNSVVEILCNPFLNANQDRIVYATFQGIKWRVSDITAEGRRLKLTLGGRYVDKGSIPQTPQKPDDGGDSTGPEEPNWWET